MTHLGASWVSPCLGNGSESWFPELRGIFRKSGKNPIEGVLVHVSPQRTCDIAYSGFRCEVVVRPQCLYFLRHDHAVFEWTSGLVCVPVYNEESAQPDRQDACEKDSILDVEAAAKNLEDSLHHRICLMGAPQPRRVPRVDYKLVEMICSARIFSGYWQSMFFS